uniref:Uncharacterized protein n=1 Tax=Anguilla anguilla TaxID=7936 RepID=A0A0E9P6Z8_ANGAN
MKAYLGTAFMSGSKVATQVSTNTRRGTWLAWTTEISMLMRSPRKKTLDALSSCQLSAMILKEKTSRSSADRVEW